MKPHRKRRDERSPYQHRDILLQWIGYTSYRQYLQSELWASIRTTVLDRSGHKCWACSRTATQVHHRKYTIEALEGDDLTWLVALCAGCHVSCEFRKKQKLDLPQANKRLRRIRKNKLSSHRDKASRWHAGVNQSSSTGNRAGALASQTLAHATGT